MYCSNINAGTTLILFTQLWLPGDRMAHRFEECCPRSCTRFATIERPFEITSDHFLAEYGHAEVKIAKVNSNVDRLFAGLGDEMPVFMSHYDKLVTLPTVSEISSYFRDILLTVVGFCGHWCHQELRVRRHRP